MRRPGHWLRIAAARLCATQTMERVIDPVVADMRTEYETARRDGRRARAVWVRLAGYVAFWKAVGLHTLQSGPRAIAKDAWTLRTTIASSLVLFVAFTLLLTAPAMLAFHSHAHNLGLAVLLLPQAVVLSIPIALALGIAWSVRGLAVTLARRISVLAGVATLLGFGAVLTVPDANQAFRVAMARELDGRGITEYSLPRGMNELPLSELTRNIRMYDAAGVPEKGRAFSRVYHLRFALPAAAVALSLLALGFAGILRHRVARSLAMVTAVGLYWACLALTERITYLPAAVWVWTPNIVCAAVALALLRAAGFPRAVASPPSGA